MSSAAELASSGIGGFGYGDIWSHLRAWAAPHEQGESDGDAGWTGEGLHATHDTGVWLRPNRSESRKKASFRRLLAVGALEGWHEAAWGFG